MSATPQRLATRLTAVGERHLRSGHPWLYDQSIERIKGSGQAGDLAIVFDRRKDRFLGIGLYDPDSPIRIKVLHQGKGVTIDRAFFQEKIQHAATLRAPLLATDTNSYRLINGESDGFPSLVADVYASVLVVKVYSQIWQPWLTEILPDLLEVSGCTSAVLRLSRKLQQTTTLPEGWKDGHCLVGALPNPEVVFKEHGLSFKANLVDGHKTGYFLDHRHNRKRVGTLAKGRTVLDVFSYAGGFSVHALAGGATSVTSLDISPQALEMARENVALNLATSAHKTIAEDAFSALERLGKQGRKFDLVVVDPPSFAKRAEEVPGALNAYRRLTRLALPLVAPGGILLAASCSARVSAADFFALQLEEIDRYKRGTFTAFERTQHDIDHPVTFPEGWYLKSIYFRRENP